VVDEGIGVVEGNPDDNRLNSVSSTLARTVSPRRVSLSSIGLRSAAEEPSKSRRTQREWFASQPATFLLITTGTKESLQVIITQVKNGIIGTQVKNKNQNTTFLFPVVIHTVMLMTEGWMSCSALHLLHKIL